MHKEKAFEFSKLFAFALLWTGAFCHLGQAAGLSPTDSPAYIGPAVGERAETNRAVTMVSSMAVSPGGRLWVTWYAGPMPTEDENNYVALATSGDSGKTWTETLVIDPDGPGPVRAFDPEIWLDPKGRLWLLWAQAAQHGVDAVTWAMVTEDPESDRPKWSEPRIIAPGVMMCKPIVLSDNTWAFPISDWEGRRLDTPSAATSQFWVSEDEGETFALRGGALVPLDVRTFDEQMFIERNDRSIWMLVRTRYGIGESISTDGGVTWAEVKPSSIPHTSSRFFITRLQSGNLLLVKHGAMNERGGRSRLMAFISKDDGHSWQGGLMLDERNGISYPDGQEAGDGSIYITYDFDRYGARQILFATFREADALAGKAVTGAVRLHQEVSQGSGGQELAQAVLLNANANIDGEPLRRESPGAWEGSVYVPDALVAGATLFSDRSYKLTDIPSDLQGMQMLRVPIDGTKIIRAARAGTVYFLTPSPTRNGDSQSDSLIAQGFKKVALPEALLFQTGGAGNLSTLYQKDVQRGEVIKIGKWAVPVFWQ